MKSPEEIIKTETVEVVKLVDVPKIVEVERPRNCPELPEVDREEIEMADGLVSHLMLVRSMYIECAGLESE